MNLYLNIGECVTSFGRGGGSGNKTTQINDNGEVSPSILWDGGKAVTRGKIIEISSRLRKAWLKQQKILENKIRELRVRTLKKNIRQLHIS